MKHEWKDTQKTFFQRNRSTWKQFAGGVLAAVMVISAIIVPTIPVLAVPTVSNWNTLENHVMPTLEVGTHQPNIPVDPNMEAILSGSSITIMPANGIIDIATMEDLEKIKDNLSANYRLVNNLDLTGVTLAPIGSTATPFTGSLDGNGYTITNITIEDNTRDYTGLFAATNNATITNLTIENPKIYGKDYVGTLIGVANGGRIENCFITGEGYAKGAQVVGGFVGKVSNFEITNISSTINVTANNNTAGGLLGKGEGIVVADSHTTGYTAAKFNASGGLVGSIGNVGKRSTISTSYSLGDVRGAGKVGGLVGSVTGTNGHVAFSDCFSQSKVTATANAVGGLLGDTASNTQVNNFYYSGIITGTDDVGGIIGLGSAIVTNSYFNSTLTGLQAPQEQAKTTEEMKQPHSYVNWDMENLWAIDQGVSYPKLRNTKDLELPRVEGVKAISITSDSIQITWDALEGVATYDVQMNNDEIISSSQTEMTFEYLTPNTTYTFAVRGKNGEVIGLWSEKVTITTTMELPRVEGVKAISITSDSIQITWDALEGVATYDVQMNNDEIISSSQTEMTFEYLTPNTTYTFAVRGKNGEVIGLWSEKVTITTTMELPRVEGVKAISITSDSIQITWDALEGVATYDVQMNNDEIISSSQTEMTFEYLTPNTTYTFAVRGKNGEVLGLWSEEIKITTMNLEGFLILRDLDGDKMLEQIELATQMAENPNTVNVRIEDGVTSIGEWTFGEGDCQSLTTIVIPESVTSIGDYAFNGCRSLTTINIPEGVTSIGRNTFSSCYSLTSITIPDSVSSIGHFAFIACKSLTSITIPDGVTSIGLHAFAGCDSLISITIPDSVVSIGRSAFSDCDSLTTITIPESVTSISDAAFTGCDSLTTITIPESVTSIGDHAFSWCDSLTTITIPDSVTSIGASAFRWCDSLTTITIPDSVTSIGDYAFENCRSLTTISISDNVTSIGDYAFSWCDSLTTITIQDSVTSIGDYAFENYRSLTTISISDNVTSIGDYAFENCHSLTTITIPDSVTSIGDYAFENCHSLTTITIPDSVISIGDYAFESCHSLTTITIPDSVTSIGDYAFKYCGLYYIEFLGKAPSVGNSIFEGCHLFAIYAYRNMGFGSTFFGIRVINLY